MAVVAIVLILCGPWLVYLACPVPDQIVEYRVYSMAAGLALILGSIVERGPSWVWLFLILGFASLSAIRASAYSSVIRFWTEASAHSSGDASRAFQELGAWTKANAKDLVDLGASEKYLREAIRLNPKLGPALNNLAWVLIQRTWVKNGGKEVDPEGVSLLEWCTECCPKYPIAWQDLGAVYEKMGRTADAGHCYLKAIEMDPSMEMSLNRLGLMAFQAGRKMEARDYFGKVSALNPSHWEYTYNHAVAMLHTGKRDEGQKKLRGITPQPFPLTPNMLPQEFAQ